MKLESIAVAASLVLAGCAPAKQPQGVQTDGHAVEAQETDSPSLRHKFRVNPDPKQRHEITMTIKDAPGSFGMANFWAHYLAPDCMYWTDKFAGTTGKPMHTIDMPVRKLDDTTYVGTVYLDGMLDEDYYGDGLCHWQLTDVAVSLKATGADEETGFAPDISRNAIAAQESVMKYFWKKRYPRSQTENFASFGQTDRSKFSRSIKDGEIFTITLASKDVQP